MNWEYRLSKQIRKTFIDSLEQFLIDKGSALVDISNPLSACKLALNKFEEHNRDRFIEQVLQGLKNADTESLKADKSLQRLYKSIQVVSKATTQEKLNRFKSLTTNGIVKQNSLSDEDYDLFLRITDELTDTEFLYLYYLVKTVPQNITDDNQFSAYCKEAREKFKNELNCSNDLILFVLNSLIGRGLLDTAPTFGGRALKSISNIAYSYIQFIEEDVNNG